jgi:hypothetical protein
MEDIRNFQESKEEGKKVWAALNSQAGEGVGFFSAMFLSFQHFLRKHFLSLALFALLFGTVGGLVAFMQKRTIQAEMTVSYAQLEKKIYADMLYKIELLRSNGEYASIASLLGIPEAQARKIARIDSRNINYEPLVKDLSTQKVPFYIIVEVEDASVLPDLQNALVRFINEPPFVKTRLKLNEENYLTELKLIQKQLDYMDSLKGYLLKNVKTQEAGAVSSLNNLNKSQNDLYARIRDLQGALRFNQNIEVMDGFVGHQSPVRSKYIKFILAGMALGACFRLVWLAFR